jgi:hypothetical protein
MIIHNTKVRLPNAPIVRPIIEINKFNVGHDLANLNTRSFLNMKKKVEKREKSYDKACFRIILNFMIISYAR